jgi:hypothetical protein
MTQPNVIVPVKPEIVLSQEIVALCNSLELNAQYHVLIYALDGVVEGTLDDGISVQKLREETATELRIFNEGEEYYAWRTPDGWTMRLIRDSDHPQSAFYDQLIHHRDNRRMITVRHYLQEDEDGFVTIQFSRLVKIQEKRS